MELMAGSMDGNSVFTIGSPTNEPISENMQVTIINDLPWNTYIFLSDIFFNDIEKPTMVSTKCLIKLFLVI